MHSATAAAAVSGSAWRRALATLKCGHGWDGVSQGTAVNAWKKGWSWPDALQALSLSTLTPLSPSFTAAAASCASWSVWTLASDLLSLSPTSLFDAVASEVLAEACWRAEEWTSLQGVLEEAETNAMLGLAPTKKKPRLSEMMRTEKRLQEVFNPLVGWFVSAQRRLEMHSLTIVLLTVTIVCYTNIMYERITVPVPIKGEGA